MIEHLACKVFEDGLGFHVEVAEHGGAFPTAKELDVVAVDASAEQSHCATGAGGASGEVGRVDAGRVLEGASGESNLACDVDSADVEGVVGVVAAGGEADAGVDQAVAAMKPFDMGGDKARESSDGAAEGVAAAALGDNFSPALILLGGEMEPCTGGIGDVVDGGVVEDKFAGSDAEVDVAEGEGLGVGSTALGRSEQEEKGNADLVGKGFGLEQHGQGSAVRALEEERDWGDGQRFDSSGGSVGFFPSCEEATESEVDFAVAVGAAGVLGPQNGERLAH